MATVSVTVAARRVDEAMASVESHLGRWQKADLLDAAQAEQILAFERQQSARDRQEDAERPGVLEAVLYLGIAVAGVGIVALTGENWDQLRSASRIGVLAVPGVLLLLAGQALRAADQPALRRASAVAWLVSIALLSGAVGVIGAEADWEGRTTALLAAAVATGLSLALWAVQPSHPQIIALAASLVFLAGATAAWPEDFEHTEIIAGLLIALFGGTGVTLTERGIFGPRSSARILGAAGVMLGLTTAAYGFGLFGGSEEGGVWLELLVFVAGVALAAIGIYRAALSYLVIAVIGSFFGLVGFIYEHFEDDLGAPLALIVSGALLVAAALLLAYFRGRFRAEAPA